MEIKDTVAIVTGASSGIGQATAKLLTQRGAKVALVARSKEKLEVISKTLKILLWLAQICAMKLR